MRLDNERGAALIMALLVMASFSLLAAAIVFTAQTDVQISANYKYGQQAYYVANAGVQKSLSWFKTTYVAHATASDYDATKAPVQYPNVNGAPVTLSGVTSNYPDSATSTSFSSNLRDIELKAGNPPDDNNKGAYQASATLLRYKLVKVLDTTTFTVSWAGLERWRLDSTGFWGTSANPIGRSEVSAVIERQAIPFFSKALWTDVSATFSGGSNVDSYDPAYTYGGSNVGSNGDIASNGNITLNGANTTINGDVMYGPTGTCTNCATSNISGDVSQLVEKKDFPPIPPFCVNPSDCATDVKMTGGSETRGPGGYGTIQLSSAAALTLTAGTYYIDKLKLAAGTTLTIPAGVNVTLYIKTDMDVQGGIVNNSSDPAALMIFYSGTAKSTLNGGTNFYGTVYAPNTAELTLAGGAEYFGSFVTKNVKLSGGANLHYDSDLLKEYLVPKPFRIITWTQKNY